MKIRGVELACDVGGSGRDLVWGHGLSSSRANEDESPLVDWNRVPARITRYDARGHGESESSSEVEDYSWASLALDQLDLAAGLGIDRYIAGGASMGCATALHAAVTAPERIERLILVIPPTAWETRAVQIDQYGATAHVLTTKGVEPIIEAGAQLAPPDPFVGDDERRRRREASLRAADPARLAQVFRGATVADLPSRDAIAVISMPALILAWTGDPGHPVSTAEELDRLIPQSTLHLASTIDELNTWTDQVIDFIA